jgi:hypothetical protein
MVLDPSHRFEQTLAFINQHYAYTPTAFINGALPSKAGQNEGSCKLLGLAKLEGLSLEETLCAFGEHYQSVLNTPEGDDHGNIRALMIGGIEAVHFDSSPLVRKD